MLDIKSILELFLKYNSFKVAPSSEESSRSLQLSRTWSGGGRMCDCTHVCLQLFSDKKGQRSLTLDDPLWCWWH